MQDNTEEEKLLENSDEDTSKDVKRRFFKEEYAFLKLLT